MDEKFKRQETKLRRNCPEEEELEVTLKIFGIFRDSPFLTKTINLRLETYLYIEIYNFFLSNFRKAFSLLEYNFFK